MARTSDFSLADAKYYCYYLSGQCRNILNYYLKQETPKSSNSIQNVVNYIFSLKELKDYYYQFFMNITELLKAESIYSGDDVVEKSRLTCSTTIPKSDSGLLLLFFI